MTYQKKLAEAVNLYIIPETKFKTVRFMIRFRESLSSKHLAERAILSSIFGLVNASYPKQADFQAALAMNYGMRLGANVSSKGSQHFLNLLMTVVEPRFVAENTLETAISFLKEVIFNPLLDSDAQQFDEQSFNIEKTNLLHYLDSLNDDNAYVASQKLLECFFQDEDMKVPVTGSQEQIKAVKAGKLYDYYQEMLRTNAIDIFVLGNVSEAETLALFESWEFADRKGPEAIFYAQESQSLIEQEETKEANQSRLAMAWRLPVQYGDEDYLALQVFNGLFGGLSNSKLFTVVRERESLAYSISSSFDSFSGLLKVTAGTDTESLERTEALVLSLLEEMKRGDFSAEDLEQTKALLRNGFLTSRDNAGSLIEEAFIENLLPERSLDRDAWQEKLEAVEKEDIQKIAQSLVLEVSYKLKAI